MKRVTTAVGPDGRGHIISEGEPARIMRLSQLSGLEFAEIWATNAPQDLSRPGKDITPSIDSLVPGPAGTRFRIVTLPPDRDVVRAFADPAAAMSLIGEFRAKAPGIADAGDFHDPAMHATPTLDYGVIVSGEVLLELDSGETTLMRPGDCIVQQGAKHAWRNRSDAPCVIAFVMIGTDPGTIASDPAS